ncbi:hypothetical protein P9112_005079 [Eukaryota sp. TZLM1-RC]
MQHQIVSDFLPAGLHYLLTDINVPSETTSLFLNIARGYRDHTTPSVQEILQNWRDQCFRMAKQQDPTNPFPSPIIQSDRYYDYKGSGISCDVYSAWVPDNRTKRLIGWVIQTSGNPYPQIFFFNNNTVLSPDILRFGHTDKKNEPYLAGHFGDGLKAEINRLLNSEAVVKVSTGPSTWTFRYDEKQSLYCDIKTYITSSSPAEGTLFHVSNIRDKSIHLDPSRYLFLQSNEDIGAHVHILDQGRMFRILLEKRFWQKIFFHGIYVTDFTSGLFEFGLDYSGVLSRSLGIGVERSYVNNNTLLEKFLEACGSLQTKQNLQFPIELLNELRRRIFKSLESMSYFPFFRRLSNKRLLGEFLYEGFLLNRCVDEPAKHEAMKLKTPSDGFPRTKYIPMSRSEIEECKSELNLFGCGCTEIRDQQLLDLLRLSSKCPVLDTIRLQFAQDFMSLPEILPGDSNDLPYPNEIIQRVQTGRFPTPEDDLLARQLRNLMVQLIEDDKVLPFWSIRFKQFLHGMTPKPITPLKLSNLVYYVVDLNQFSQENSHRISKKNDPSFECRNQNCSCIHLFFLEEILRAVDSVFPSITRKELVNKKLQRLLLSQISTLPTQKNIPDHIPDSFEVPEHSPTPIQSSSNSVQNPVQKPLSAVNEPSLPNPSSGSSKGPPRAPSNDSDDGPYLENVVEQASNCVEATGKSSTADSEVHRIFHEARVAQQVASVEFTEEKDEMNLVKNDQCCLLLKQLGMNVTVYCNPRFADVFTSNRMTRVMMDLACVVSVMWGCFYNDSNTKCNIFYDESRTIAFNRAGQLFFNVFFHSKIVDLNLDHVLSHWFVVFCHELAHNKISNHGKEFGAVVEHITMTFLPVYTQKIEEMKMLLLAHRDG